MSKITEILKDFFNLFLPYKCTYCGINLYEDEEFVCKSCLNKIPKTHYHKQNISPIDELFMGKVKLEHAFSCYLFTKGSILQSLIHKIKYKNAQELAISLGKEIGFALSETNIPRSINLITSVPLHHKKLKIRGYNQSDLLAKGISEVLNIPFSDNLIKRVVHTSTQTKKNREQRWNNVKNAFEIIEPKNVENKHIAIVDDVLTTGATLEAAASKLLMCKNAKVSLITLAYASN